MDCTMDHVRSFVLEGLGSFVHSQSLEYIVYCDPRVYSGDSIHVIY